jgi:hypothetical protein
MKRPVKRPAKFRAIDEARRKFQEWEAAQAHQPQAAGRAGTS